MGDRSSGVRALLSAADLEAAIRESRQHPVFLFVHSRDCGLSHLGLAHLREHMRRRHGSVSYVVTVQTQPHLCAALTRMFGLQHETPLAILVDAGKVVWHRSHHHITAEALDRALTAATEARGVAAADRSTVRHEDQSDDHDDHDDKDDDEAPETPTDEPPPTPLQDPPHEPDQRPYTVSPRRGSSWRHSR